MKKIRVLVVDDAAFMRDMVKRGLRSGFPAFEVEEAADGRQALTMLERSSYDLVLCDWEMPQMSGAELLQWLRDNEATCELPFVMITSRGDRENVMQAVELKVNNYIVKPFTNEKLINVVGSVLSRALGVGLDELRRLGAAVQPQVRNAGSEMISILTANSSRPPAVEEPQESVPAEVRPRNKVMARLRFSGQHVTCLLRQLSREKVVVVARRVEALPGILELAVLDIEVDGEVGRLNGYVHTLQAREDSSESEFVNVTVNLVDQGDEQKMALLQRYMASIAG